jgi:putative membrane protein
MATNTKNSNTDLEKKYRPLVIILSIVIPVVVALLFGMPKVEGFDLTFLPPIYASINGLTAVLLVLAVISIKKGNRTVHQRLILSSVICSLLFLVGYVAYHLTSDTTLFGDLNHDGAISALEQSKLGTGAYIYYFLLASHIILSIGVIPLVMLTYLKGWSNNLTSHRKWAKVTFPIWLYVAVSGVVVYLMISPYYA